MNEQITALEAQLAYAPNDEEKDKIKAAIVMVRSSYHCLVLKLEAIHV